MSDATVIQYDAFISYAWRDANLGAEILDARLRADGFRVWRDKRDADPTQDFRVEIEKAIEASVCIIVCVTSYVTTPDSYVQREIAYAKTLGKPIFVTRYQDVSPPEAIKWLSWLDFFDNEQWQANYPHLCDWIRRKASPDADKASPLPTDPYRPYVEALYKQIVAELKFSVFSDDAIPLRSQSVPDAVPPPTLTTRFVTYSVAEPKLEVTHNFDSFRAAFYAYDGRVLLLGEPGAGKTTTLLVFARDIAAARLNDPSQPLPILARVANWNSLNQPSLTDWLAEEINTLLFPPKDIQWTNRWETSAVSDVEIQYSAFAIRNLVASGDAVLLLDGLDELGSGTFLDPERLERGSQNSRAQFLSLIPPSGGVVLTSRVIEYHQIGQRVGLKGAVILKPLDDAQLRLYLTGLDDLWSLLESDQTLRDALRTPLLMALFRSAYAELPEQARELKGKKLSSGDVNDAIWSVFIERRWNYEQARNNGKPLKYSIDDLKQVLGIAAASMMLGTDQSSHTFLGTYHVDGDRDLIAFAEKLHLLLYSGINSDSLWVGVTGLPLSPAHSWRFRHPRLRDYFAFTHLNSFISHRSSRIRSITIREIGKLEDDRFMPRLIERLTENNENADVCAEAARVLGRIGNPNVTMVLEKRLNDYRSTSSGNRVCDVVADVLRKIGTQECLAALKANGFPT